MTELEHMQQYNVIYLDKIRSLEVENKKLKEALHKIADCGCPLVENEYGYTSELPECRRIAESVL